MITFRTSSSVATLALSVALISLGCSSHSTMVVEAPPAYQPTPIESEIKAPILAAAKLTEVQEAVQRVFKDAAIIDSSNTPNFFTGDFNGDASQDLAVVLRPAPGKLSSMNEEYPSWLLRDPLSTDKQNGQVVNVEERDVLLAIIHGYGDNDWRDAEATQTFLLKNVVGNNLRVKSAKDFQSAHSGRRLPRPQGDLIEETLRGADGYLYYANANYSWYDPKTFKPKADIGMVHGGR